MKLSGLEYDLPYGDFNVETANSTGNDMGQYISVDLSRSGQNWDHFQIPKYLFVLLWVWFNRTWQQ